VLTLGSGKAAAAYVQRLKRNQRKKKLSLIYLVVGEKKGVWIKEQGSKLKDGGPMANKRMIILLYTDPIGYADSPPLSSTA